MILKDLDSQRKSAEVEEIMFKSIYVHKKPKKSKSRIRKVSLDKKLSLKKFASKKPKPKKRSMSKKSSKKPKKKSR